MRYLIYGSPLILALGMMTSITLLALSHIMILFPALSFIKKTKFREFSISSWALLGMSLVMLLSVIFNQDVMIDGVKSIFKTKYFLIGFFSIAPLAWWTKNHANEKNISYLLYILCISTTIATIFGIVGMKTGYNYITMKSVGMGRNIGICGHVLTYAHNLAFFLVIIFGMILYRKETERFISTKFLSLVFIINLVGIYLSYSRGPILALLFGIPFYFLKESKGKFIAFMVFLSFFGAGIYFYSGKNLVRPKSDRERLSNWQAAVAAFKERPILGFGYINFERNIFDIKKRNNIPEPNFGSHAHNNFLEMLASVGILGFVFYISWLVIWFIEMYKRDDLIAKISIPFIVVFIVGGLTQSTITIGANLFFIMAVYSFGQINKHSSQQILLK